MAPLRICTRCALAKPEDEFALRSSVAKGLVPRAWCKECDIPQKLTPEQNRRKQLMSRYGLTPLQFQKMGDDQKWRCPLCLIDLSEKPYVDHDHETGKVRKLLCFHCNLGLGHFRDSPEIMARAIEYIRYHTPPTERRIGSHLQKPSDSSLGARPLTLFDLEE